MGGGGGKGGKRAVLESAKGGEELCHEAVLILSKETWEGAVVVGDPRVAWQRVVDVFVKHQRCLAMQSSSSAATTAAATTAAVTTRVHMSDE